MPIGSSIVETRMAGSNNEQEMLVLPGWLGHAAQQHLPLLLALSRNHEVFGLDYVGPHFNPTAVIREVANSIIASIHSGRRVHLFGTSVGGIIAAMAVATLRDRLLYSSFGQISMTLVDSPSGAESLKQLPARLAPMVAMRFAALPLWLNRSVPDATFRRIFCNGMPKNAPIEVPPGMNPELYRADVRSAAYDGQQGFEPTLALGQLAFMAGVGGPSGTLARACAVLADRGVSPRITYVACMGDNEVVRQPLAMRFYVDHLPNMQVLPVYTGGHSNYAQSQCSWNAALQQAGF